MCVDFNVKISDFITCMCAAQCQLPVEVADENILLTFSHSLSLSFKLIKTRTYFFLCWMGEFDGFNEWKVNDAKKVLWMSVGRG